MVKQANDNVTPELFATEERDIIKTALVLYQKTLNRQAAGERNAQIRNIKERESEQVRAIEGKF